MSKNRDTQRIPILVDEGFIKLHPGVLALADENSSHRAPYVENIQEELQKGLIEHNPLIIGYPATDIEMQQSWPQGSRHDLLEPIFIEALGRKCS